MKKGLFFTVILSLISLTGCSNNTDSDPTDVIVTIDSVNGIGFSSNNFLLSSVSIHTENQINFWNSTDYSNNLHEYANMALSQDKPNPITIEYSISVDTQPNDYTIHVFRDIYDDKYENDWYFTTNETTFDLYNCEISKLYYITVTANYDHTSFQSDKYYFNVLNDGPRNLYIDGVVNARDIGYVKMTSRNTYIRQGLIYRTGEFNEDSEDEITLNITDEGIDTMINQLGIVTDIDLRKNASCDSNEVGGLTDTSPLGESVNYINLPMYYEGQNIFKHNNSAKAEINKASILEFFEVLGDENNYPMVVHCSQGKDRTGALMYVVEALLGMDEDGLIHDYLFSNFTKMKSSALTVSGITGNGMIGNTLNKYENGDTLAEKTYNYLIEYGVPSSTLDSIRNIMSEDVDA